MLKRPVNAPVLLAATAHVWTWAVVPILLDVLRESPGAWQAFALPVAGTAVAVFCVLTHARRLVLATACVLSVFVILTVYSIGFFHIPTAILLLMAGRRTPRSVDQSTTRLLASGLALAYLGVASAYLAFLTAEIIRLYSER